MIALVLLSIILCGAAGVVTLTASVVRRDGYRQRPAHSGYDTRHPHP